VLFFSTDLASPPYDPGLEVACMDQYCARYIPGGRGKGEPSTGTHHLGFRLVMPCE
jgi:hypothetical protein